MFMNNKIMFDCYYCIKLLLTSKKMFAHLMLISFFVQRYVFKHALFGTWSVVLLRSHLSVIRYECRDVLFAADRGTFLVFQI